MINSACGGGVDSIQFASEARDGRWLVVRKCPPDAERSKRDYVFGEKKFRGRSVCLCVRGFFFCVLFGVVFGISVIGIWRLMSYICL